MLIRSHPVVVFTIASICIGCVGIAGAADDDGRRAESLRGYAREVGSPGGMTLRDFAEATASTDASAKSAVTNLSVSVESGGSNVTAVAPGGTVYYEVVGVLSDDASQGLALVGLDLAFDGGDLEPADIPTGVPTPGCDNPMINFTRPWGITNPDSPCPPACGFGGTIISGDLIQVGGGQDTMSPDGSVLLGVAQPGGCGPAVLAAGSLTAPTTEGTYTLSIPAESLFANVIRLGETGDPFWAVEAASGGVISNLTINVTSMDSPSVAWVPIGTGSDGELPPGSTIEGNEITIYGDIHSSHQVFLEFRLGNWDPTGAGVLLKGWQAAMDASIFAGQPAALAPAMVSCSVSEDCIGPLGGVCTITGGACAVDADCPVSPIEYCQGAQCAYPIGVGGYCEPGWQFCGRRPIEYCLDCGTCPPEPWLGPSSQWVWADASTHGQPAAAPSPFPQGGVYGGSLVVETPVGVEGVFTVGWLPIPDTILIDQDNQFIAPVGLIPATIRVVLCGGGDCQGNGVPDECDLVDGTSVDCNANGVPDECDAPPLLAPLTGVDVVATNRYLAFESGNVGESTAVRVTFVDLPPPHDVRNGRSLWVGAPGLLTEHSGSIDTTPGFADFSAAMLACDPLFMDWSAEGTVYVHHEGIVAGGVYAIQEAIGGCSTAYESSFGPALMVEMSQWGDLCAAYNSQAGRWDPPDGTVSFAMDIVAMLDKFRNLPTALSKVRSDIAPGTLDLVIGAVDLAQAVDAFAGASYPYAPEAWPCPE